MNFFKRLLKGSGSGEDPAQGASSPASRTPASEMEPFDFEVRMVHLPEGGSPRVWKTRAVKADAHWIYIEPPEGPPLPSQPVTLYVMTDTRSTEFDAAVRPINLGDEQMLRVERPPELTWKTKEGAVSQKRKFLRIDVSLPIHLSVVVPTLSGKTLKVDEPHDARMVDLSVEGCSVLTDFEPPVDRLVEVKVLGPVFPLTVQGKIVRVIASPNPTFRFSAAIVFHNHSAVTRDMIGGFILERQREKT